MKGLNRLLKVLFFLLCVRPLVLIYIGLNVRNRQRLPKDGPAILVANHNSHLDTMVLMSLFPLSMVHRLRPVAAADYFLRGPLLSWFSREIIGIIPLNRTAGQDRYPLEDKLAPISEALHRGEMVIFFPEGTRGEAERPQRFKKGIGLLAQKHPQIPVIPIYLHGLGKALPRGEIMLVPFFCDVMVGEAMTGAGYEAKAFATEVEGRILALAAASNHGEPKTSDRLYY